MSTRSSPLWTCPKCRRRFAKRNQWHSCQARLIEDHFEGKPVELWRIYQRLVARIRGFGPLRIDAVKSSINLAGRHHFGGLQVGRDRLRVGFLAKEPIADPRILRREILGPGRVGHSVILRSAADVDDQLVEWLERAYQMQTRTKD